VSFDLDALRDAVTKHGRVARVVIAAFDGSSPRETGAAMLVWKGGQSGTIGGGALEFEAAARAFEARGLRRVPLGPALGQCCGGTVTLLTEVFDAKRVAHLGSDIIARPVDGCDASLAVQRVLANARGTGVPVTPQLLDGWMIEPVTRATRPLWVYGAGHVGRAIVAVLAPLPDFAITWVDASPDRFPADAPAGVTLLPAANPSDVVRYAPFDAEHLILTYSHALDLELCHRILSQEFSAAGLIGSATKRARFRKRLAALGHSDAQISRITCPIGDPALGKHPQAIAVGVALALLSTNRKQNSIKELRQ
jgi:xanthine dehydrogenase accessory factor